VPELCSGLLTELGSGFELLETRAEIHQTPSGKDQLFNFFRLMMRAA